MDKIDSIIVIGLNKYYENIKAAIASTNEILDLFNNGCKLITVKFNPAFSESFNIKAISIGYGVIESYFHDLPNNELQCINVSTLLNDAEVYNVLSFHESNINSAIKTFIDIFTSNNPDEYRGIGEKIDDIRIKNIKKLDFLSHYDYCDKMLTKFFLKIFGKTPSDMWCNGIVVSHGDKAYGYKREWEKAGIPFHHGVLIFLLTYTSELGDTPKHESSKWVISNYTKYAPIINTCEKEILKEEYQIDD